MQEVENESEGFALARDLPVKGHVTFRVKDIAYFVRRVSEGEFEVSVIGPTGAKRTYVSQL
jgi:hypothetical protein